MKILKEFYNIPVSPFFHFTIYDTTRPDKFIPPVLWNNESLFVLLKGEMHVGHSFVWQCDPKKLIQQGLPRETDLVHFTGGT